MTITDNRPDQDALAQVFADPNCFTFQEIAPGDVSYAVNELLHLAGGYYYARVHRRWGR